MAHPETMRRYRLKFRLHGRMRSRCAYCGRKLQWHESTLDHFFPRSKGGGMHETNAVLACEPCNVAKGDRVFETIEEAVRFVALARRRVA
jgi:5-methylcytosine-specific restriction endonuclease McrA